jgi:hypothetical protein
MNDDPCSPGQECSGTQLCFKHKAKTLVFGNPRTPTVKEWRDDSDGHRIKATKDDATTRGNITIEHNTKDDRMDVNIRPDVVRMEL